MNAAFAGRQPTPKRFHVNGERCDDANARDHDASLRFLLHHDAFSESLRAGILVSRERRHDGRLNTNAAREITSRIFELAFGAAEWGRTDSINRNGDRDQLS